LWALKFISGIATYRGLTGFDVEGILGLPITVLVVVGTLLVDAVIIRPCAIYAQRAVDDTIPRKEISDTKHYNFVQKICRFVFYYEGVLSGCSGLVYFVFPELFLRLYGIPANSVAAWSLAQFGILVTTFGIYQMNSDLDTRAGHVFWWLVLDIVWLGVYWVGISRVLGPWNPLTFSGANFWCQSAFHADSTLAVARTLFLLANLFGSPSNRKEIDPKKKSQ